MTTCTCSARLPFRALKTKEDLAEVRQRFRELLEEGLLELLQNYVDENHFDNTLYRCTRCGCEYILNYVHKGFRGYCGPVEKPAVVDTTHFEMRSVPLRRLLDYLLNSGHEPSYNGSSVYGGRPGNWVNFGCCFDEISVRRKFNLPATVEYSEHYDVKGGSISMFYDEETGDAIFGPHPLMAKGTGVKTIRF
ncbi:MAG: hypothetical protein IBJ09_15380 [Bacteroidia bacterium]|nr:hypothetical protein [Bacteroidia bacterium]